MAEVLLIIPTYGAFDYAKRCIESFQKYTAHVSHEIILIDDCSPGWPTELKYLKTHYDWGHTFFCMSFSKSDGLTRSWNIGLDYAKYAHHKYTICGNSDLLFTKGWYEPMREAMEDGYDLIGPMTNAPGHCPWQNINKYALQIDSDNEAELNRIAMMCNWVESHPTTARINGFCMMAKTDTWWQGSYDIKSVFDPRKKLTGNEDELQIRWLKLGKKIGFVPKSFIFHYRSVSRPYALSKPESKGAYRPDKGTQ